MAEHETSRQATTGQAVGIAASGPPETALDPPDVALVGELRAAHAAPAGDQMTALEAVAARWPRSSLAWAAIGDASPTTLAAYAAYRVGYHRGLDQLRSSGWKGSGYVRWQHEGNRGFLRCLAGLERTAGLIGELDEQERCRLFLLQLEPSWPPEGFEGSDHTGTGS
jgi:hypothetical protein